MIKRICDQINSIPSSWSQLLTQTPVWCYSVCVKLVLLTSTLLENSNTTWMLSKMWFNAALLLYIFVIILVFFIYVFLVFLDFAYISHTFSILYFLCFWQFGKDLRFFELLCKLNRWSTVSLNLWEIAVFPVQLSQIIDNLHVYFIFVKLKVTSLILNNLLPKNHWESNSRFYS